MKGVTEALFLFSKESLGSRTNCWLPVVRLQNVSGLPTSGSRSHASPSGSCVCLHDGGLPLDSANGLDAVEGLRSMAAASWLGRGTGTPAVLGVCTVSWRGQSRRPWSIGLLTAPESETLPSSLCGFSERSGLSPGLGATEPRGLQSLGLWASVSMALGTCPVVSDWS